MERTTAPGTRGPSRTTWTTSRGRRTAPEPGSAPRKSSRGGRPSTSADRPITSGNASPAALRDQFAEQIAAARTAANTVADELEAAGCYGALLKARDRVIHGASTISAIIADVERATSELERRGKLTPELQQLARQVEGAARPGIGGRRSVMRRTSRRPAGTRRRPRSSGRNRAHARSGLAPGLSRGANPHYLTVCRKTALHCRTLALPCSRTGR